MAEVTLFLPKIATINAIENEFIALFNANGQISRITIDFTKVRFIEPSSATSYLIAILYLCRQRNIEFRINPLQNNGIKIILYAWRFFEVIEEITSTPVREFAPSLARDFEDGIQIRLGLLTERVCKYYNDLDKQYIHGFFKKKYLGRDSIFFLTANEKFFPLLTLNFSSNQSKQDEFFKEKERWNSNELINLVLSNNLKNIEIKDEISGDIVSETISNAIMHSDADKFFTGSFFSFNDSNQENKHHFTINFWDNGKSIIDTLGSPLKLGKPVRSIESEKHFHKRLNISKPLEFIVKQGKNNYDFEHFSSFSKLEKHLPDEKILLASFFPGVSREPHRKPDLFRNELAGIGLSYLTNTVINKLEGSVAIRTKNLFLNVRQFTNKDKNLYMKQHYKSTNKLRTETVFEENSLYYSAKFNTINNCMPEFIGNMITIRIPLK